MNILDVRLYSDSARGAVAKVDRYETVYVDGRGLNESGVETGKPYDIMFIPEDAQMSHTVIIGLRDVDSFDGIDISVDIGFVVHLIVDVMSADGTYDDPFLNTVLPACTPLSWRFFPDGQWVQNVNYAGEHYADGSNKPDLVPTNPGEELYDEVAVTGDTGTSKAEQVADAEVSDSDTNDEVDSAQTEVELAEESSGSDKGADVIPSVDEVVLSKFSESLVQRFVRETPAEEIKAADDTEDVTEKVQSAEGSKAASASPANTLFALAQQFESQVTGDGN